MCIRSFRRTIFQHLPNKCQFASKIFRFNSNISKESIDTVPILKHVYSKDSWTNLTPRVLERLGENVHNSKPHPLNVLKKRIINFFYKNYVNRVGNPTFSVYDNISPVVTTYQNFDSLLVPKDHVSRSKADSYYINQHTMLRAHTSAHQEDLIRMGLNAFLVVGDVYRRDAVDRSHFPVFHQMEGVRLFTEHELSAKLEGDASLKKGLFETGKRSTDKQETHTMDGAKLLEFSLKESLSKLALSLFGKDIECRWVEAYFPFTHPSWELEIKYMGQWLEVLGCGIMEQEILTKGYPVSIFMLTAGAENKVGWAFGLGLERLAMKLYDIPDIRLFWTKDDRFLKQFDVVEPETEIVYKTISKYANRQQDLSFWLPTDQEYSSNDFYDLVRTVGGTFVEEVELIDEFFNPKTKKRSHCYRITYSAIEWEFTLEEAKTLHTEIAQATEQTFNVALRV